MRNLILLPLIILFSCTAPKQDYRIINIKAIGWQLRLPSATTLKDSSFNKNGDLKDAIPSDGPSLRLLVIKDSSLGSFSAYLRKDTSDSATWRSSLESDTKLYFETMKQIPKYNVLKTDYSTHKVGGIAFLVQHVKFIRKNSADTGLVYHYYGKINDNDLNISFEFFDSVIGKKYVEMVNSSKFVN